MTYFRPVKTVLSPTRFNSPTLDNLRFEQRMVFEGILFDIAGN